MSHVGYASRLISLYGYVHIEARENVFYEIGEISYGNVKYPYDKPPNDTDFHYYYSSGKYENSQMLGIFSLTNRLGQMD